MRTHPTIKLDDLDIEYVDDDDERDDSLNELRQEIIFQNSASVRLDTRRESAQEQPTVMNRGASYSIDALSLSTKIWIHGYIIMMPLLLSIYIKDGWITTKIQTQINKTTRTISQYERNQTESSW